MKRFMNALLTITLLIMPAVFAENYTLRDSEQSINPYNNQGVVVHSIANQVNSGRSKFDSIADICQCIARFLSGTDLQHFAAVSLNTMYGSAEGVKDAFKRDTPLFSTLVERSCIFMKVKLFTTPEMLVVNMFSELMHNDRVTMLNSTNLLQGFLDVVDKLNLDTFISNSTLQTLPQDVQLRKAMSGNLMAQNLVANGYAKGMYGFDQDITKVEELAHLGWKVAQDIVANGYAEGMYGFVSDITKVEDFAHKEWDNAQQVVTLGYAKGLNGFKQDSNKLLDLAHKGWESAQSLVELGYAEGMYVADQNPPILKDPVMLLALAHKGCKLAQLYIAIGYAEAMNGVDQDLNKLFELAHKGWKDAQALIVEGYEDNETELSKNPRLARLLRLYFKMLNENL